MRNSLRRKFPKWARLLLLAVGLWLVVAAIGMAVLSLSLRFNAPERLALTSRQIKLLKEDPHVSFYSARRYEELSRYHPIRRLPRYLGVWIVGAYFSAAGDDYAQAVARGIPFRVHMSPSTFDHGLEQASKRLFQKPLHSITDQELKRLMRFSACPVKHPLASTVEP